MQRLYLRKKKFWRNSFCFFKKLSLFIKWLPCIYMCVCVCVCVCYQIGEILRVYPFYLWSVQVFAWVAWYLDGMNSGRHYIFLQVFSVPPGAIFRGMNNEMTNTMATHKQRVGESKKWEGSLWIHSIEKSNDSHKIFYGSKIG